MANRNQPSTSTASHAAEVFPSATDHGGKDSEAGVPVGSEGAVEGEAVGKSMEELTNEKEKELDEKMKNSDGSIKYAKPGRSDILP